MRRKQKLRTTARRLPQRTMEDYDREPNISFTKALAVVVIMHIVAIAGIVTFSSIKAHKISSNDPILHSTNAQHTKTDSKPEVLAAQPATKAAGQAVPLTVNSHVYQVKNGDTVAKIAASLGVNAEALEEVNGLKNIGALRVGQELRIPPKNMVKSFAETPKQSEATPKANIQDAVKPAVKPAAAVAKTGGETYVVVKGDNPVAIARKFHVSYDELLKINKIEDPKKLKIGQKLKIPTKTKKP